jgi:Flp pilus assembly pilin Flp
MLFRPHPTSWSVSVALRGLAADDSGQDLVEYALITSFIGIAGYLVLLGLGVDIFNTYDSWVNPTKAGSVPTLWDPPAPSGS